MKTSPIAIEMIQTFESCRLDAYKDAVGIWTIGWGCIQYENGQKVKAGDTITAQRAEDLLLYEVLLKESSVNILLQSAKVNENQFDALISFTYNVGVSALANSTLLSKLKRNAADPSIRDEFMKWVKGTINGTLVTLPGLVKRRQAEADLYFTPV